MKAYLAATCCLLTIYVFQLLAAETPFKEGELIIQLKKRSDIESFGNSLATIGLEPVKILSKRMNIWLFQYNLQRASANDALNEVLRNNDVVLAQFNHYVKTRQTFPNDPYFNQQWDKNNTGQNGGTPDADIDAPEAWDITTGGVTQQGDTVVIAIVDEGADLSHQDLDFWKNKHEIPGNGIDDDNNGYVDDYDGWNAYNSNGTIPVNAHGTHVSGIAGAVGNNNLGVSGLNWGAKIMPVAGSDDVESVVVEAYGYVLEMRKRYNETNGNFGAFVVVTNSSFGVDQGDPAQYPIWCAMYDSMGAAGILSCAATANHDWDIDVVGDMPTACPSDWLISVTNTTNTDSRNSGAAYGLTTIDLGSPGTNILSTLPGNNYGNLTGTSMASPNVAGSVALLFAAANSSLIQDYKNNPGPTALLFKGWILDGTDPIPSLQGITVTGGRLNVYNSVLLVKAYGDSLDPIEPTDFTTYSDYTTPTSIELSWTDPTNFVGGDTLLSSEFNIQIKRNGILIDSVGGGSESYFDMGLDDGREYTYSIFTKVVATDSTSAEVSASWTAGGSPIPAPPDNLVLTTDTVQAKLVWEDPTTQEDGTSLDDLDSLLVYRDSVHIASLTPGVETYTDTPPPGFVYTYAVKAKDNESPPNLSEPSNETSGFVGTIPNILVWVGPDVVGTSAASGDSLFEALLANGENTFLTNDLFEFGPDLSIYEAVFVVLGIYNNNHVLGSSDPEAIALETYLQNGGRIFLEGGDCFNYDPENGGYNIRPWFNLNDGPDGTANVSGVIGLNNLSAFAFDYSGENNYMDELQLGNSTPVWQNNSNTDISGVFNVYGSARTIGVVPSFGGFDNSTAVLNTKQRIAKTASKSIVEDIPKLRVHRENNKEFVKKAGYFSELKKNRKSDKKYFEITTNGVHILANNKVDLMAAYLAYFRAPLGSPVISLSDTVYNDTLLVNGTATEVLTISNSSGTLGGDLTYSISENPEVTWLGVAPASDTVTANQSEDVTLSVDASGLTAGDYTTTLEIASNDPANPIVNVIVNLNINGGSTISVSVDSIEFDSVFVGSDSSISFSVLNMGTDTLEVFYVMVTNSVFGVDTTSFRLAPAASQEVQVTFTPLAQDSYNGLLRLISNDPVNDTLEIALSGYGETPVGIVDPAGLPTTYRISPNYPNPFNPATSIKYQLPQTSDVELSLYNVLGQKVRTLVNARVEAGYHSVVWDGRNDAGERAASGIYICRFQANDFLKVQKMVLMK